MAKTIILCDSPLPGLAEHRTVIGSSRFLAESATDAPAGAAASRPLRVINLCHSAHYLDGRISPEKASRFRDRIPYFTFRPGLSAHENRRILYPKVSVIN